MIVKSVISLTVLLQLLLLLPLARSAANENELFNTPVGKELLKRSKAADIKSWMDTTHNPCGDFYNFACANWQRINSAQLFGDHTTSQFHDMFKSLENKMMAFLTDPQRGDIVEDKLKDFFLSCLRTRENDVEYLEALRSVYREYGEFSFFKQPQMMEQEEVKEETSTLKEEKEEASTLEEDKEETTTLTEEKKIEEIEETSTLPESASLTLTENSPDFNWWSTLAKIRNTYGLGFIFSLAVLDDINNTNRTMVYWGPPNFEMSLSATNPKEINVFLHQYLGIDQEKAKEIAKHIKDFHTSLRQCYSNAREGYSISELSILYNVTDLHEEYKQHIDVVKFLQLTFGTDNLPQQIYVYDKKYFESVLNMINASDPNVVEDYILWSLIRTFLLVGSGETHKKMCVSKVQKYFSKPIDHAIYQQYRSEEYEKEVYELWNEIKGTFHDSLKGDKYYWMSNSTRQHALKKLEKMQLFINSHDNEDFPKFFKDLQVTPTNYVTNVQALLKHIETLRPNKFEKPTHDLENDGDFSFTPLYRGYTNDIAVPVSLLQPYRLWHPIYPKAIKYGTLGFLLAHEMVHGFDDDGRHYDANGNAINWWDEKSEYEFESRRRCFQAQYHNYTYVGRQLPNSKNQVENIADNAGLRIAYAAYIRWLEREKQTNLNIEGEDVLPNLEYNNRELFFISFAQVLCEDVQSLFKHYLALSDLHAPSIYRVIGPLSNCHDFSWIFRCDMKPDTAMNPSIKCELY
ncbi:endothelin-converting enzyme homolog [Musca autumnalis]|uniref:endothelin-converting enzyme homolog n=1 Tax=Musca autumnalis TaxID=221902 RepID=UPI003CF0E726